MLHHHHHHLFHHHQPLLDSSSKFPFTPSLKPPLLSIPGRRRHPCLVPSSSLQSLQSLAESSSILASIIFVHESGHFLAASSLRIRISQFSIGFGPSLARFSSPSGILFSLRAFPLGGFVSFPDPLDPHFPPSLSPLDPDLLRNRPLPHRLLVVSAGVAANLLFAFSLLLSQTLLLGTPVRTPLPGILIPDVTAHSPAASAGILPGDIVLDAPSVRALVDLIKANPATSIPLTIARKTLPNPLTINVTPVFDSDGSGRIGVQLAPNFSVTRIPPASFLEAVRISGREFVFLSASILDGLKETFLNFSKTAGKVSGPVAIIAAGAEVARSGSEELFQFAAVINLNLAAINLLPLPALDGGTMVLLLVEAVRGGRQLPREVEQRITSSGVLVVLMLGLILIVRDTLNLDFVKEIL